MGRRALRAAEKAQVFVRYRILDVPNTYEVDHLISLELGGSNDITNLWPEPLAGPVLSRHCARGTAPATNR